MTGANSAGAGATAPGFPAKAGSDIVLLRGLLAKAHETIKVLQIGHSDKVKNYAQTMQDEIQAALGYQPGGCAESCDKMRQRADFDTGYCLDCRKRG